MNSARWLRIVHNNSSHLITISSTVNSNDDPLSSNNVLRSEEHNGEKTAQYEDGCETQ